MSGHSFADIYRTENLEPTPEQIQKRQAVCDKIRPDLSAQQYCDLARLYYGLPSQNIEWFKDAFAADDASFSMVNNGREATVLAACLLNEELDKGDKALASLTLMVANAQGYRKPAVFPQLISIASQTFLDEARETRSVEDVDTSKIKQSIKAETDLPGLINVVKSFSGQLATALEALSRNSETHREEIDMLWWYIGGWSKLLNTPFKTLQPGIVAIAAALDLAALSRDYIGPVAAPELLRRIIGAEKTQAKISIAAAIDILPTEVFPQIGKPTNNLDFFPIMTAILKADEIGKSPAWHEAYKKVAQFDPKIEMTVMEIAYQAYYEALLVHQISGN